jgi:hypothetical protein
MPPLPGDMKPLTHDPPKSSEPSRNAPSRTGLEEKKVIVTVAAAGAALVHKIGFPPRSTLAQGTVANRGGGKGVRLRKSLCNSSKSVPPGPGMTPGGNQERKEIPGQFHRVDHKTGGGLERSTRSARAFIVSRTGMTRPRPTLTTSGRVHTYWGPENTFQGAPLPPQLPRSLNIGDSSSKAAGDGSMHNSSGRESDGPLEVSKHPRVPPNGRPRRGGSPKAGEFAPEALPGGRSVGPVDGF